MNAIPPLRSPEVRRTNERIILRLLRDHGPASQSEIVARTGLQASTVFRIFIALERRGLIRKAEPAKPREDRVGRRPTFFGLRPTARIAIGAELAGTGVSVVVIGFDGAVLHHETLAASHRPGFPDALETLIRTVERAIAVSGVSREAIVGLAVGLPGVVDIEGGSVLEYGRFEGMDGLPIAEELARSLGIPAYVHNNTAIIALSEYRYGRAKGVRSLVAFLLRSGVGGAYINDGRIAESQGRSVFEVGHLYPDTSSFDRRPSDGWTVIEDYLGERPLLEAAAAAGVRTWDELLAALQSGDGDVAEALRPRADMLAATARNIALLLSPEAFLVVTRFSPLSHFFARSIEARFAQVADSIRLGVQRVIPVAYDSLTAGRGAAGIVFDRYLAGAPGFADSW